MRTIKIKLNKIKAAIDKARQYSDDWQAELCGLLAFVPKLAKRWQEINLARLPWTNGLKVEFVDGIPHKGSDPENNKRISAAGNWAAYAGFTLTLAEFEQGGRSIWNSVREDHFGHSPGTAWDGVRRETIHRFLEAVRCIGIGQEHHEHRHELANVKIQIV